MPPTCHRQAPRWFGAARKAGGVGAAASALIILSLVVAALRAPADRAAVPAGALVHTQVSVAAGVPVSGVIRLHVVASEGSPEAARVKEAVRDAVVEAVRTLVPSPRHPSEVRTAVLLNLPLLRRIATHAALRACAGYSGTNSGAPLVSVSYGVFDFPERVYRMQSGLRSAAVLLPAGRYEALKAVIGEGRGSNWWCILFPPLCIGSLGQARGAVRPDTRPVRPQALARLRWWPGGVSVGLGAGLPTSFPFLYLLPR